MNRFKILAFMCFLMLVNVSGAVSTRDTNLDVLGESKSLYGRITSGASRQLIGTNSSDLISIDEGGVGVAMSGDVTIAGEFFSSDIQEVSPNASATTSMTAQTLLIYNGATVGTANIVLPASPSDGQIAKIITQPAVTVLSLTSDATAINGAATGLSANTATIYMYSLTTTDWHKLQ